MDKKTNTYLKTGFFVITTTVLFILALYKLAGKRGVFNSSVRITAVFKNVNGLTSGNNVRFGGIDIGTVSKVSILSDTVIQAELDIQKAPFVFITSSSLAAIGTDGLMGNKIINISPGKVPGKPLREGDALKVEPQVEFDAAVRTLNATNENLQHITENVQQMTTRFVAPNTLWDILMDTSLAGDVKSTLSDVRSAGKNVRQFSEGLSLLIGNVNQGKGNLGMLLADSSLYGNIHRAVLDFRLTGRQAAQMTGDLSILSNRILKGKGSLGSMLQDTALVLRLDQAVLSFKEGAANFDSSMIALKHNYLLRKYFKEKDKEKGRKKKKNEADSVR
jgi:phospholipid/cholesterol/gamma-HCH transport system substrate-binding protein